MNQRSFILGTLLIVIAFLFAVGVLAMYSSGASSSYKKESVSYQKSSMQDYTPTQYGNQIVVNKYNTQPTPTQPSTSCHQQVTGYYNNQPVIQCIPDGTPTIVNQPPSQVTKVYVQTSVSGSYYPYPKYNYPKYPHYGYQYHKYPYFHYQHPPYFQYW